MVGGSVDNRSGPAAPSSAFRSHSEIDSCQPANSIRFFTTLRGRRYRCAYSRRQNRAEDVQSAAGFLRSRWLRTRNRLLRFRSREGFGGKDIMLDDE